MLMYCGSQIVTFSITSFILVIWLAGVHICANAGHQTFIVEQPKDPDGNDVHDLQDEQTKWQKVDTLFNLSPELWLLSSVFCRLCQS